MRDGCLPQEFRLVGVQVDTESGGRGGKFVTFDN